MILGITGGTGCGKTTLLEVLGNQGALILDCDAIYHRLLQSDTALLNAIETQFPGTVVNGTLDRKKLGNLVFSDEKALLSLNEITHSAVKKEVLQQLENAPEFVAIDAIALFEGGLGELCDTTVAVLAPREDRIRRIMARENISRDYAEKRIDSQHDDSWFREKCRHVLYNDGTLDAFRGKCLAFYQGLSIIKEKQ